MSAAAGKYCEVQLWQAASTAQQALVVFLLLFLVLSVAACVYVYMRRQQNKCVRIYKYIE